MHNLSSRSICSALIAVVVTVLNGTSANAAVDIYRLFKTDAYQQTSNAQPTTLSYSTGNVDILFSDDADFSAAQVTSASPLSPMLLSPTFPGFVAFDQGYTTAAARDVDFPNNTTYDYEISGGTLGTQTATLSTPASDLFASQVPFFNGTNFDQLQGMDPASAFSFTLDGYDASLGSNTPLTFFAVIRESDGQIVYTDSGPNTQTSFVLPANTLQSGTAYFADLVYSSRNDLANAGFGGAASEVGFDLRTDLHFVTAVPEPSTLALAGIGALAVFTHVLRRRRINTL